jgi:hypothetical protein
MEKLDFDSWAFKQCVTLGNEIVGIKNEKGVNVAFVNTTTKEEYRL